MEKKFGFCFFMDGLAGGEEGDIDDSSMGLLWCKKTNAGIATEGDYGVWFGESASIDDVSNF